ncbi:unnamed protein product [Rangifer tarandus platyrhynchus]|uniref:Uncharacterized protein n=3 Tax=Rangifer tarandus platyrhynchus TaxID=3082113 RepID=A0AC59ZN44_RANTA|nr:unnamed protein product [Rangifer tarandus platyrhynchus]CAI9707951.1 unnamed protein product [Rangifer tarandus platyrhynchus]
MLGKDEEEEIHAVRKPGFASARQQALAKHSDRRAYMALRVCPYSDQSVQGWISIPVVSLETGGSLLMSHPLRVLTDKSVAVRPDLWESIKSLFGKLENGDSSTQSVGFELLRRSGTGKCRRPWSRPCSARHEAAPEKGPGGSTFRASGGTGLLLNASLRKAWPDGLLTVRRRCSLTERQAEREIRGPPLKSARGGRCTRKAGRVRAEPPTHRALPLSAEFLLLFLVQWSRAVHWEEQRAGEDSETHTQTHRDDLVPGSRLREQTCAPLL